MPFAALIVNSSGDIPAIFEVELFMPVGAQFSPDSRANATELRFLTLGSHVKQLAMAIQAVAHIPALPWG